MYVVYFLVVRRCDVILTQGEVKGEDSVLTDPVQGPAEAAE